MLKIVEHFSRIFSYFGEIVNDAINDEKTEIPTYCMVKKSVTVTTYLFCIQWLINDF